MTKSLGSVLSTRWRDIRATPKEDDWYDERGLLLCGRCGEYKECMVDRWAIPGMDHDEPRYLRLACACLCGERKVRADPGREGRINRLRAECYDIPGLSGVSFDRDDGRCPGATATVREWLASYSRGCAGLYLYGPGGSGKTWAAAAVVNELLSRGKRCAFSSLPLLSRDMDYRRTISRLSACDLVAIDDIGAERGTDTAREGARVIIDAVYAKGTTLIVTSNLTPDELARADARVGRRVSERCLPVKFS